MISSILWPGGSEEDLPTLAAHQEQAVAWVRERLDRYGGAILADEPGLGKSWVAAVVLREKISRGQTVELVVPASLRTMWSEVRSIFSIEASVVTHEAIRRGLQPAAEADFVVVDEAHRFRNEATKGWSHLGRRLIGSQALFLTATPIWNAPSDLLALLRLLVADHTLRLAGVASIESSLDSPTGRARIVDQLVLRRSPRVLAENLRFGELRRRTIQYPVPDSWSDILEGLEKLRFPHALGVSTSILSQLMILRLHSSPTALRATLERQLRFCRTGLDLLRDGYRLNRREFRDLFEVEDLVQGMLFPQLFLEPENVPDADDLQSEIGRLEMILVSIDDMGAPKLDRLVEEVTASRSPSLIFVAAVDTAKELFRHLSPLVRCGLATGMHCRSRRGGMTVGELTVAFQDGQLDHLIMTDLGGEGLNLQRADRVIHYDLPWSPMRVEQRNGRARRIGRDGRPLEVITFRPERGVLPTLEAVEVKAREHEGFWICTETRLPSDVSLERLPARIAGSHPQARLWKRFATSDREWLLRRHRPAVERMMEEVETRAELDELIRMVAIEETR